MNDHNQFFTDLRAALTGDAALSALVGTRVYRSIQPQGAALPCIVMHHIGGEEISTSARTEGEGDERQTQVQFDCLAASAPQSSEVCSALRAAIESARETPSGETGIMSAAYDPPFTEAGGSVRPTTQSAEVLARTVLTATIHHVRMPAE